MEDLINLNLTTLEGVVSGKIDNRKAGLIFTGSRTVSSALKLGLEAMKLGMIHVGGMALAQPQKKERIEEGNEEPSDT